MFLEFECVFFITLDIALDFLNPISGIMPDGKLLFLGSPISSVPKISITEYCHFGPRKDDVRLSWKRHYILAVSETHVPESFSEHNFMFGALAPISTLGTGACH